MTHLFTCTKSAKCYSVTQCYTAMSSIDFNIAMTSFSAFKNLQPAPFLKI